MSTRIDPETGEILTRGVRNITITYKGLNATVEMSGWYKDGSDEGIISGEDMKVSDRALNRLKAQAAHMLSPEEIRKIRQAFHLTQAQAGALIGGGPNAFQKYESGDLLPSKAISNFLRFIQLTPNAADVLKKLSQTQEMGIANYPDQVREAQRNRA